MRFQLEVQVVYLVGMLFSCVRIFKTITNTTTLDCITASDTARRLISYVQRDQKPIFRWFKFTLKPPYSGASERSLSAIWDTSHWNFFVKFGLRTA